MLGSVLDCQFVMITLSVVLPNPTISHQKLLLSTLLLCSVAAFAQRTVVQDAGGGKKLELHYNAAGQVTETRTIGADGKLLEKDDLEYPAGALVPQSVSTSYWPNGQVHKITHNTYDNNSNFTGEFIQVFDDTGKQIGGHRLTHDPQTNVYTCAEWNTAANDYKLVECPAGEESSGAPETVKKFTAEEVMQQLARARAAKPQPAIRTTPPPPVTGNNVAEVGFILPAQIRPGERVSGSVVDDPGDYENSPEVMVTRVALPFAATGKATTLAGWQVEISGEPPQAADGPIALTVPPGQLALAVLFRQADSAGTPVSKTIHLPATQRGQSPAKGKGPTSYLAPAVCVKDQLCTIRGPFSGDSSKTFAAFEARPAKVVAETPDAAYLAIPDRTEPGPRPLAISEGDKAIAFPMVVAEFSIHPDRRELSQGQTQLMYPEVEGPGDLPDPEWRPGNFPPSNLEQARKILPGFQPSGEMAEHDKHAAEERREKAERAAKAGGDQNSPDAESEEHEGGEILLVIKNLTPAAVTFRNSKNGMFVFHLNAAAFKMGEFKYKFVVEANKTGNFGLQTYLMPFLAPVVGQEFPVNTPSPR